MIAAIDDYLTKASKDTEGGVHKLLLQKLFDAQFCPALLDMVQDAQENNRTRALACLTSLSEACTTSSIFPQCVITLHSRIAPKKGSGNEPEPAEEVRLEVVKLLRLLLAREEESFYTKLSLLVELLAKAITDPFPDLKKETAATIIVLAEFLAKTEEVPFETKDKHYTTLVKAVAGNLGHQHGRVRITAIQAIGAVVKARGGDLAKCIVELMPVLNKLTQDRSASVRKALPPAMLDWLGALTPSQSNKGRIMMLLLAGVADENEDVHTAALSVLDRIGEVKEQSEEEKEKEKEEENKNKENDNEDDEGDEKMKDASVVTFEDSPPPEWQSGIAAPLTHRPPASAREAIVGTLSEIIPATIKDLTDWTAGARVRGAGVLHTVILYAEHYIGKYVGDILPALYKTARDSDSDLNVNVLKICRAIGWLCDPDVYLPVVTNYVLANSDSNYRCSCLVVMANLVAGVPPDKLGPYWGEMVAMVGNEEICTSADQPVRFYALKLVEEMMKKSPCLCRQETARLPIFLSLLHFDACAQSKEEQQAAVMAMMTLASAQSTREGDSDLTEIYGIHFADALIQLTKQKGWGDDFATRNAAFTLLKRGVSVIPEHMDVVLPLLVQCAHKERDPRLRVDVLKLLYTLLFTSNLDTDFLQEEEVLQLLVGVVIPQLVWCSGAVASAIRLQACVCLEGMLRKGLLTPKILKEVQGDLAPVLKGNLDDDEPEIRIAVVKIYGHTFELANTHMEHIDVTDLHRELVKRMDDSNDDIRIEVARVFGIMMKTCFPPFEVYDTSKMHFEYIVKSFLIHLDDSNPEIQKACFEFLQGSASYHSETFKKQLEIVRGRHSDPTYVERLIEFSATL